MHCSARSIAVQRCRVIVCMTRTAIGVLQRKQGSLCDWVKGWASSRYNAAAVPILPIMTYTAKDVLQPAKVTLHFDS